MHKERLLEVREAAEQEEKAKDGGQTAQTDGGCVRQARGRTHGSVEHVQTGIREG